MENKGGRSFLDISRKSLTFSSIFNDDDNLHSKQKKPRLSVKSYLDSLLKENADWNDIYKQKQEMCKKFEEKCKLEALIIKKEDIYNYIYPEDKEFLEDKPNYSEMVEGIKKYIIAMCYFNEYKKDLIEYYSKASNEIEINNKIVIENMCSENLCDICNKMKCEIPEHKFT